MPELPEVETVCRKLKEAEGQTVKKIQLNRSDLRFPLPEKMCKDLAGQKILRIYRRAKYVVIEMERHCLLSHLGMTGNWLMEPSQPRAHDHIEIFLSDTKLVYNDPRRFGYADYCKTSDLAGHSYLKKLGVEPLEKGFSKDYLWSHTKSKNKAIKTLIMDQAVVVGVGNIYANEALFLSGIRPSKNCRRISGEKVEKLVRAIKQVLKRAIKTGGSSIKDFSNPDGETGYFQIEFQVYGRDGEPCKVCGDTIKKNVIGQRATFYCPSCQK